jgi:hypothetical protein
VTSLEAARRRLNPDAGNTIQDMLPGKTPNLLQFYADCDTGHFLVSGIYVLHTISLYDATGAETSI